jgi:hypothetical protein
MPAKAKTGSTALHEDENVRLIRSLLELVNTPYPLDLEYASRPFRWALEAARSRKKELRHRINFHADDPGVQAKTLILAQRARDAARGILWWLATQNDVTLDEPVLFDRAGGQPKVAWWKLASDAWLLEEPMIFRHFKIGEETVVEQELAIWDRPSTCIAHALDLLLTDYRGLRGRVRACPFIDVGAPLSQWNAKQITRDHTLHFFVDDRFEKGQPQIYCSVKHRQTSYMRKYRREQSGG